jgi:hypothetical protein
MDQTPPYPGLMHQTSLETIAKLKETQLELDQLIFLKSSDSSHPWVRRQWQGQRHCTWQT